MPVVANLIKGKKSRYLPWLVDEHDIDEFVNWMEGTSGINTFDFSWIARGSYFSAIEYKGEENYIGVIRDSQKNKFCAMCFMSKRHVFINGKSQKIAYFSSLFIEPEYRKGLIFGLLFRLLHYMTKDCVGLMSMVMDDNEKAKKVLQAGLGGNPAFFDIGGYTTIIFDPKYLKLNKSDSSVILSYAKIDDLDALIAFLRKQQKNRQFFPNYNRNQILDKDGLLKDIHLENILLAKKDHQIVGSMTIWDQSASKIWMAKKYPKWIQSFRLIVNFIAGMKKMPKLPKVRQPIDLKLLALVAVENNNQKILQAMLHEIVQVGTGATTLLGFGTSKKDSLFDGLGLKGLVLESRIYFALSQNSTLKKSEIEQGIPYLELGSL